MARKPIGMNPGPVAVRTHVIQKRSSVQNEEAHGQPCTRPRIVEFPVPSAVDEVIRDRIIFEVGGDRFAITWTAQIEQLPPAGPVAVERKQRLNSDRSHQINALTVAIRE